MKTEICITPAKRIIIAGLVAATVGVIIQILSGVHYPKIAPVFFILLIPAGLVAFVRIRWIPAISILSGFFLIQGLFSSGASSRLVNVHETGGVGGSVGLWIQMVAVLIATFASILTIIKNYRAQRP